MPLVWLVKWLTQSMCFMKKISLYWTLLKILRSLQDISSNIKWRNESFGTLNNPTLWYGQLSLDIITLIRIFQLGFILIRKTSLSQESLQSQVLNTTSLLTSLVLITMQTQSTQPWQSLYTQTLPVQQSTMIWTSLVKKASSVHSQWSMTTSLNLTMRNLFTLLTQYQTTVGLHGVTWTQLSSESLHPQVTSLQL